MNDNNSNFLHSKTRSELASEYGVTRKTFYNWLKKENIHIPQGAIKPCDVRKIYQTFGTPEKPPNDYSHLPTFTQKNRNA